LAGHLVTAAKDRRRWDVIPHLGARLATAVVELLASVPWLEPIWLTPIPSAPSAVRRRGLDVSCRLAASAQGFLRQAGLDCRTQRWLRLARPVADQAGLNYHQRQLNLAGAYRLIRSPPAADRQAGLILVDDVATTGASLAEGWRVCRQADLMVLGAATVTATSDRYDSAVASVVNRIQVPVLRQEKTSPA
jgi:predicted amidophosphoribosyltransferase